MSKARDTTRRFKQQLAYGQVGENAIREWIRRKGGVVLPVYETEGQDNKGPRLFTLDDELVAPDMLVMHEQQAYWIEAKRKAVFTWHRITHRWTTGVDRHHFQHYLTIAQSLPWKVFLYFLHESATPDQRDLSQGSPKTCPTGLFAGNILRLAECINHEHDNWGRHGMVYWAHESLTRTASCEEITQGTQSE